MIWFSWTLVTCLERAIEVVCVVGGEDVYMSMCYLKTFDSNHGLAHAKNFLGLRSNLLDGGEKRLVVIVGQFFKIVHLVFCSHNDVSLNKWSDVHKGNCLVVLINFVAGNLSLDDFGKNRVFHTCILQALYKSRESKYILVLMQLLRRMSLGFLATILSVSLFGLVGTHLLAATVRQPATVKAWLNDSEFYDNLVGSLVENAEKGDGEGNIPLEDPEIKRIINESFSPEFLKASVEDVLDGTYGWLEGKTAKPEFNIDLATAKQKLADGIGAYATKKAAALPVCTRAQLRGMDLNNVDPFTAECRPSGVSAAKIGNDLKTSILNSKDFLSDTNLTGDDLSGNNSKKQNDDLKKISQAYRVTGWLPIVFLVLATLSAIGIFFLSSERLKGARRIGVIFLGTGVILGLTRFVFNVVTNWLDKQIQTVGSDTLAGKQIVSRLMTEANKDIGSIVLWYAIGFVMVGIVAIGLTIFMGKNTKPVETNQKRDSKKPTVVK